MSEQEDFICNCDVLYELEFYDKLEWNILFELQE